MADADVSSALSSTDGCINGCTTSSTFAIGCCATSLAVSLLPPGPDSLDAEVRSTARADTVLQRKSRVSTAPRFSTAINGKRRALHRTGKCCTSTAGCVAGQTNTTRALPRSTARVTALTPTAAKSLSEVLEGWALSEQWVRNQQKIEYKDKSKKRLIRQSWVGVSPVKERLTLYRF